MAARLKVASHLSTEEVFERYRKSDDVIEKVHWQIVWLKAKGESTGEVARLTGYNTDWIRRVVRRYNEHGPESLGDGRLENGREPLLDEGQQQELFVALQGQSPDGGLWNSTKVAAWISERVGRRVGFQRGWIYMRRLGLRLLRPRPRHAGASAEAQEAFKKNSPKWSPKRAANIPTRKSPSGVKTKPALA